MFKPSTRRLLPVVLTYLPVPVVGAVLSAVYDVGASPESGAGDMFFRGTAVTPPLFLPALLVAGAVAARSSGRINQRVGVVVVGLVSLAFLGGSTLNLPNDFAAADAAGSPLALTAFLAAVHIALSLTLLANVIPALFGRRARMATIV